ncbi:MAG TPA: trypsin-like peptidase domain-containing protein [Membranihabitans sp.]|nr:trypsin-like peptidase domain-containing protein [Membranihabitans sp.]
MKNIAGFLIAGLVGGLVVVAGMQIMNDPTPEKPEYISPLKMVPVTAREIISSQDLTIAAERAMPAVVHIKAAESESRAKERYIENRQQRYNDPFRFFFSEPYRGPMVGFGSGVIISEDGYVVTNDHVIEFADKFEITLNDNQKYEATIVGRDPDVDLAVLKIDSDDTFSPITFGNSDRVKIGEWVLAVGNPFDLASTVTAGIISAKGRGNIINRENAIEDFIQTDAVVNKGNSGGALVNAKGDLIGINSAIASPDGIYAGYAFAIPSNIARQVIDDIIQGRAPQVNTEEMSSRPYIGFELEELTSEVIQYYNLPVEHGLIISKLDEGSPADRAGFQKGDIIIAVNSREMARISDFLRELDSAEDTSLEFIVNRQGKILKYNINV